MDSRRGAAVTLRNSTDRLALRISCRNGAPFALRNFGHVCSWFGSVSQRECASFQGLYYPPRSRQTSDAPSKRRRKSQRRTESCLKESRFSSNLFKIWIGFAKFLSFCLLFAYRRGWPAGARSRRPQEVASERHAIPSRAIARTLAQLSRNAVTQRHIKRVLNAARVVPWPHLGVRTIVKHALDGGEHDERPADRTGPGSDNQPPCNKGLCDAQAGCSTIARNDIDSSPLARARCDGNGLF